MEVLRHKLVSTTEGATTVSSGGLNRLQIIKIARAGIQHDFTAITNLSTMSAREWTYLDWSKRVVFRTDTPFAADENIYIMYKVIV